MTAPGVADIYQGTELWDFSLVDPDNRRPVDYERRGRLLQTLQDEIGQAGKDLPQQVHHLWDNKEDGRAKLYLIYQCLRCRRAYPGLFAHGDYLALETAGSAKHQVFGFVRQQERATAIVVVPRFLSSLAGDMVPPLGAGVWKDTVVGSLALGPNRSCRNILTGEVATTEDRQGRGTLPLADLFAHFPVALLLTPNGRT
jgi:(1->4)-alpha-D-glucan 1-alpha-D-glucosylmutase